MCCLSTSSTLAKKILSWVVRFASVSTWGQIFQLKLCSFEYSSFWIETHEFMSNFVLFIQDILKIPKLKNGMFATGLEVSSPQTPQTLLLLSSPVLQDPRDAPCPLRTWECWPASHFFQHQSYLDLIFCNHHTALCLAWTSWFSSLNLWRALTLLIIDEERDSSSQQSEEYQE